MSRSHHTTRRNLGMAARFDEADLKKKAARIEELQKDLAAKRAVKRHVRKERQRKVQLPPTPIDSIPIGVKNSSPFVHFPASPDDLRALLERLPAGLVDGLTEIELSLGEKCQRRRLDEFCADPEPDPLVGRVRRHRLDAGDERLGEIDHRLSPLQRRLHR